MRYAYFVMGIAAALLAGSSSTAAAAAAEEIEEQVARGITSTLRVSWSSIQEEYANANSEFLVCESEAGKDKKAKKACRSARRKTKRELFDRVDNLVVAAELDMEEFIMASKLRYHAALRSVSASATEAAVAQATAGMVPEEEMQAAKDDVLRLEEALAEAANASTGGNTLDSIQSRLEGSSFQHSHHRIVMAYMLLGKPHLAPGATLNDAFGQGCEDAADLSIGRRTEVWESVNSSGNRELVCVKEFSPKLDGNIIEIDAVWLENLGFTKRE